MNRIYYGDNLRVLRARMADESLYLRYLHPPFKRDGRLSFKSAKGRATIGRLILIAGLFIWLYPSSCFAQVAAEIQRSAIHESWLEPLLKSISIYLASGVEGFAAIIIGAAAIEATIRALGLFIRPSAPPEAKELVRLRLGRWLALALEFELAADILRTAIAPTWNEIGQLAAIVVLRTALNFFLQQEIDKAEAKHARPME